jgi:hypothetical protein
VELVRLPAGAELLEHPDFDVVRERDGRVELLKTVMVPANDDVTTTFRYRLPGASLAFDGPRVTESVPKSGAVDVDPRLSELRVTLDRAMRDRRCWAWVQADAEKSLTTGGAPPTPMRGPASCR